MAEARPASPPPRKPDRIAALKLRDFRFLFVGTVTSGFGQWATMIGLGWLAYVLSGESAAQLAWVIAVGGAMRLLSAPWIGVVLDRSTAAPPRSATRCGPRSSRWRPW